MILYKGKIINIGPLVSEFISAGILVFFGDGAPPELVEFSIIHDAKALNDQIKTGDFFQINENNFQVLAVGEVANKNIESLGHIILKFNGKNKPELPGDVNLEETELPKISTGDHFQFFRM